MRRCGRSSVVALALSSAIALSVWAEEAQTPPGHPPTSKQVPIRLDTADGPLHGTIDLPAAKGPVPVLIVIAGSGPTDRDGNQRALWNDSLKLLGRALAGRGIAAVRFDRRGVGESARPDLREQDVRIQMFADDVVEWVRLLRKDPRFSRVGIAGHSEGALVGILAAKREPVDVLVSIAGPGRPLQEVLREQQARTLPRTLREQADSVIDELVAGRTVDEVPRGLEALFRPTVQPFLISLFRIDPARELADVRAPVLIVQGTNDLQVTVRDAERLGAGGKDAKVHLVEGMNHVLKHTGPTRLEQQLTYVVPLAPLSPGLADTIADFVLGAAPPLKPAVAKDR